MTEYTIIIRGCDDETKRTFELTKEQVLFLTNIFNKLNENSSYACQPTIRIKELDW